MCRKISGLEFNILLHLTRVGMRCPRSPVCPPTGPDRSSLLSSLLPLCFPPEEEQLLPGRAAGATRLSSLVALVELFLSRACAIHSNDDDDELDS